MALWHGWAYSGLRARVSSDQPYGFLCLPAPGDDTVHTLARKLTTLVFKRFVGYQRGDLPEHVAERMASAQAMVFDLARRNPQDKRRVGDVFAGIDVQNNVLALGVTPAVSAQAAELLIGRVLGELGLSEAQAVGPAALVRDHIELARADTNPLNMIEDHPDKAGNRLDLGDASADDWCAGLREALALIDIALPELAREFPVSLRRLVPVGVDDHKHLSASYREAPGLVYLTLHPNPVTMAEALVHESQHGKLNLLSWFDPILDNAYSEWSPSPVRPDMRPIMGVLLAAHAFVPVAWLHRGLARANHPLTSDPWFERRRAETIASNGDALTTLRDHAKPTPTGERVLTALHELHAAVQA